MLITKEKNIQNVNDPYMNENQYETKEVISRGDKTIYTTANDIIGNNVPNQNCNIINITLVDTSSLKVVIPAPKTITFEELFKTYSLKASIPLDAVGKDI